MLAVIGGGTGAASLNSIIYESLPELVKNWQVVHLVGRDKLDQIYNHVNYHKLDFTTDSLSVLLPADLVITRAGLGTLTELGILHKTIIVVPMSKSHQEANAELIAEKQAGLYLHQEELTSGDLVANVNKLWNDVDRREMYAGNLAKLFPKDGAERVVGHILRLLKDVIARSE